LASEVKLPDRCKLLGARPWLWLKHSSVRGSSLFGFNCKRYESYRIVFKLRRQKFSGLWLALRACY